MGQPPPTQPYLPHDSFPRCRRRRLCLVSKKNDKSKPQHDYTNHAMLVFKSSVILYISDWLFFLLLHLCMLCFVYSGGLDIQVEGTGLDLVQFPKMVFWVDGKNYASVSLITIPLIALFITIIVLDLWRIYQMDFHLQNDTLLHGLWFSD